MCGLTKLLVLLIVSGALLGCQTPSLTNAAKAKTAITPQQKAALHAKALEDAGLRYYWKCEKLTSLLNRGERIARTYLLDENFYCLTTENRLMAIDATNGTLQWGKWVHAAKPGVTVFDPAHAKDVTITRTPPTRKEILQPRSVPTRTIKEIDLVVISTRTNALVIDRKTGDVIRDIKFSFATAASAGVCTNGRLLFVPDSKGTYHALLMHEMLESWSLAVEGAIKVAPRYVADKVVVAFEDGHIQVANTFETRKRVWTRVLEAGIEAPILATANHLLVPCMDRLLYAFDTATGQRLWEPYNCKKPLLDAPQLSDVSVFQYAQGGQFHALALVSGKLRWTSSEARSVLAAMKGNVYLKDADNRILQVDEILGEIKASIDMPKGDLLTANTAVPGIYGATRNGKVYCVRLITAGHITAEMLKKKSK
jgi:outer membrane protein assembly factor BamB